MRAFFSSSVKDAGEILITGASRCMKKPALDAE